MQCREDAVEWLYRLLVLNQTKLSTCERSCLYSVDGAKAVSLDSAGFADLSMARAMKLCKFCSHARESKQASDLIR
jgi:hypothetical protein